MGDQLAERLAKALLAAVSNEDLGKAIAEAKKDYEIANSDGSAEALINAEIESLISNAIGNADLAVGFIVKTFEEDAAAATNIDELNAAFEKGGAAVNTELDTIQTSMTRSVTALAPGFDLTPAYEIINTITQAAEVEARMNMEKETSRF